MDIWRYGRVYLAESWELGGCLRIDHIRRSLAFPTDSNIQNHSYVAETAVL